MPEIVTDIMVTPATLWYGTLAAALPADGLAVGAAWPAGWTKVGFTQSALKATYDFDVIDVMVEQDLAAVDRRKIKESLTLETSLSEISADLLGLSWDSTVVQTAVASGVTGKEEMSMGGISALTKRQFGFEGSYIDEDGFTLPLRVFVWKATVSNGSPIELAKTKEISIPITIAALSDRTKAVGARLFKVSKILEVALP